MIFLLGLGGCEDPSVQYILFSLEMCLLLKLTNEKHHINVFIGKYGHTHIRIFWVFSCFYLVEKVANESQKTPRDVVMMENFHHIFATLSRLKISCLEAEKKEAKQKYTDHLQSYVIYSLGQPLEKLNVSIFSLSIFFLVEYIYICLHMKNTTDSYPKFAHV